MPRKRDPLPQIEIVIDTSPEARTAYREAIRYLIERIRMRRAQAEPEQLRVERVV